jgi:hypothetical protein
MATITITTTTEQDARIAPAFGSALGLGRNATVAEVKGWLIERLRSQVFQYERELQHNAISIPPLDPT